MSQLSQRLTHFDLATPRWRDNRGRSSCFFVGDKRMLRLLTFSKGHRKVNNAEATLQHRKVKKHSKIEFCISALKEVLACYWCIIFIINIRHESVPIFLGIPIFFIQIYGQRDRCKSVEISKCSWGGGGNTGLNPSEIAGKLTGSDWLELIHSC